MNGQTLTWSQDELYTELVAVRNQVDKLINKVLSAKPPKYGSDAWWEESDRKAMEDIKNGRYTSITNKKELKKFLRL